MEIYTDPRTNQEIKFRSTLAELTNEEYQQLNKWEVEILKYDQKITLLRNSENNTAVTPSSVDEALSRIQVLMDDDNHDPKELKSLEDFVAAFYDPDYEPEGESISDFEKQALEFEKEAEIGKLALERDKVIAKQIDMLVQRRFRKVVAKLKAPERVTMKAMLSMTFDPWKMETVFTIKGANKEQIADLEEELKKLHKIHHAREIFEIKQRIISLKKNKFILLPVQKAIFAVRVRNEISMNKLDTLPTKLQEYLTKEGLSLEDFVEQEYGNFQDGTLEEREDALKRDQLFQSFRLKNNSDLINLSDEILTHLVVPWGEPYSEKYALVRQKYFAKMKADKVMSMLNFINAALKIWNISSAIYSVEKEEYQDFHKFQNVKRLVESINGLQSLITSSPNS